MRIVLTAQGTRGDVQPFILLGVELSRRGHDVLLVGPPSFRGAAEGVGLSFAGLGADYERYYAGQQIGAHVDAGAFGATRQALDALEKEAFEALPELVTGADLVLATGVATASRSAAETAGADYRFIAQCVRLIPSDHHAPVFVTANTWPRMLNRLTWQPFTKAAKPGDAWNARRAALGLPRVERGYTHMLGWPALTILAADELLAPLPSDLVGRVVQTCAIQPAPGQGLTPSVEEFLAAGEPPVYVGFGSLPGSKDADFLGKLARGLADRGLRSLIAAAPGTGGGPLPEGAMRVGDVPHASLFPRLAAVVHHGGAGVTQAAARAGVPQLVVPFMLDQPYWGWRVSETGLGRVLPRAKANARTVGEAVADLVTSAEIAARADEVAQALHGRDGVQETADAILASVGAEARGAATA